MKILKTILLGVAAIGCIQFFIACSPQDVVVKSMYEGDDKMWTKVFSAQPPIVFPDKPFGVILPHHMVVGDELTKFYKGLEKTIDPPVVVIISPNHYQNGENPVQTCLSCTYETIEGDVSLDSQLIEKIISDKIATAQGDTFIKEHGLYNHAPYIKKFFPKAKFIPIALKWEATLEETETLAKWLNENLPEDALVVASVDFSHYITAEAANFHDITSFATIKNFDYENIYNLEVDSPPSLSTITHLMQLRGYEKVQRFQHTNNQDYRTEPIDSTTSHQFIGFFKGEKQLEKSVTIFSVGNIKTPAAKPVSIPVSNGFFGFYDNYRWNISGHDPNLDGSLYLRDIRGQEDRFLVGANFIVFNLPINTCTIKVKNGLRISFCEFNQNGKISDQLDKIRSQKQFDVNYTYLLYTFSDENFTDEKKQLAQDFATAGVDLFVGRGLKDTLPIEELNGKILAYSLGDFIADPSVAYSSGIVLGVAFTPTGPEIFTFPIEINDGYPKVKTPRP